MSDDLRNLILTAEIFNPGWFHLGWELDRFVLEIEALRSWDDQAVLEELQRMEAEGLVHRKHGNWRSTFEGQVARERFVQSVGMRAACLRDQHLHELDDLVLAIVVAPRLGLNVHAENEDSLRVYLYPKADDCRKAGERLIEQGYARGIDYKGTRRMDYYPTGKGMRHYEDVVRTKLGILDQQSILDSVEESTTGRREAQAAGRQPEPPQVPSPGTPSVPEDRRFTLATLLGEGTMGEVWRARDLELNRDVAVKFVLAVGEQDALAHAKALARVAHPNIVAVYDIATLLHPTSGVASRAVVMELVNGTPLVELIGPAMTREDVERVGIGLIGALTAYHSAGLAHLDIHDGNVMVATDSVKVLDPLYYETAWFRSTATRDKQQARDVRQARDVLLQMVHGGSIPTTAAHVFNQATVRPTLELLRTELERALSAGTVFGVGSAAETVASTTPPDLGTEAKHRELRAAYSTWLVEVRSWLKSTLGVGLKLEASGDPIASHEGQDPDQPRRLDAAKLQVLFLEQNPSRVGKVNDLSAVIGLGGLAKPQTAEQHRVFGRRIIAVTTARLKELDAFQVSIADWLAIGPR